MSENKMVQYIPARPQRDVIPVGIYCRVSTSAKEQLNSLFAQVSALTRHVALFDEWKLADTYIEVASSKGDSARPEFKRLIQDCKQKKIKLVIVKNISRFGRDTVTVLDALQQLKTHDVRVIFMEEKLDTKTVDSSLMISIIESIAQAENESRSANIKIGLNLRAKTGTSKLYQRKCYGYTHDKDGMLTIDDEQAENVRLIFSFYLQGYSIGGIIKELESRKIPSPTGKEVWYKRSIDTLLSNEKYIGEALIMKSDESTASYLSQDNHPPILSKSIFYAVQAEKEKRSSVIETERGKQRKSTKYSSKRNKNLTKGENDKPKDFEKVCHW